MGNRTLSAVASAFVLGACVVGVVACDSAQHARRVPPGDGGTPDAGADGATSSNGTGGASNSKPDAATATADSGAKDAGADVGAPDAGPALPITEDAGSGPGVLEIELTHAPKGGDVTITGPNNFSRHITTSTTLVGLAVGSYSVTSKDVRPATGNVRKANPARANADIEGPDKMTVKVDYGTLGLPVAASAVFPPGLWFTLRSTLVSLPLNAADGDYNADFIYDMHPAPADKLQAASGLAFDTKGGVWIADSLRKSIGRISAGGTVTGALGAIDLSAFNIWPYAIAFDKNGNLWVDGQDSQVIDAIKILGFDAATLSTFTVSSSPSSTYSVANVGNTGQMAFDANSQLWMSYPYVGSVGVFQPALTTTGTANFTYIQDQTWDDQLPIHGNVSPAGVAFDAAGNLWSSNQAANEVVGYAAANLTSAISSRTPDFHFTLPEWMVNGTWSPARLAIDPCSLQIYVLTITSGAERIFRYDISDPANPVLKATVTSPDIGTWYDPIGMATNPIPPGMPLHTGSCPAP